MNTRRKFIEKTILGIAGLSLLPDVNTFARGNNNYQKTTAEKLKLRFAVASDLHYGEPGVDYTLNTSNMVKWLNEDHEKNKLDTYQVNASQNPVLNSNKF